MTDSHQPEDQITFICGQCGQQNFAPLSHAGTTGNCVCGAVLVVPYPQANLPNDIETPAYGAHALSGPPQPYSEQQATPSAPLATGQVQDNLLDSPEDEEAKTIEEEQREKAERQKSILKKVRIFGVIGSALLIIGAFCPFFSINESLIVEEQVDEQIDQQKNDKYEYFGQDPTDRVFIVLMGIISATLFFWLKTSRITWNFAAFIIAFLILGYDIFDWKDFEDIKSVDPGVIEPSWGFIVVFVGFVLGCIGSFMSRVLLVERFVKQKKGKSSAQSGREREAEPEREERPKRRKALRGRKRRRR